MLFMVTDYDRWGWSKTLVRALTPAEAVSIACPDSKNHEVEMVVDKRPTGILWSYDESPDSTRNDS